MYSQEQVHTNVVQLNCTSTEGQGTTSPNLQHFPHVYKDLQKEKQKYLMKFYFN